MFSVANTAALPNVVTRDQLPAALSQAQAAYSCVRTFGSLLGGTLYSLGEVFPFLVNAVSFGASVFSLGLMRGNFQSGREGASLPLYKAVAEGFSWLWKQPLLRFLTLVQIAYAMVRVTWSFWFSPETSIPPLVALALSLQRRLWVLSWAILSATGCVGM
jgi:hypothetical protein